MSLDKDLPVISRGLVCLAHMGSCAFAGAILGGTIAELTGVFSFAWQVVFAVLFAVAGGVGGGFLYAWLSVPLLTSSEPESLAEDEGEAESNESAEGWLEGLGSMLDESDADDEKDDPEELTDNAASVRKSQIGRELETLARKKTLRERLAAAFDTNNDISG